MKSKSAGVRTLTKQGNPRIWVVSKAQPLATTVGSDCCLNLGQKVSDKCASPFPGKPFCSLQFPDIFPNYATESPPIGDLMTFYKESKKRFDEVSHLPANKAFLARTEKLRL